MPLGAVADALLQQDVLIVVAATYNGRVPDNIRTLEARLGAAVVFTRQAIGLRYAVLGYGNSQWSVFQVFPKWVEAVSAATSVQAIAPRDEVGGNAGLDTAVEAWVCSLWSALDTH